MLVSNEECGCIIILHTRSYQKLRGKLRIFKGPGTRLIMKSGRTNGVGTEVGIVPETELFVE